ncbi:Dor1-domain-containing protein [Schizopora paradoxa]|uniref:Conserved oligomeric Golgi complex subunit 8 n=1 Tax=Schizopora paradoxa TaxID=27342 RepID=A0A0H2S873_9AGAM|nr:Dor1-domain-containing protein [Schizopora paradoxa]
MNDSLVVDHTLVDVLANGESSTRARFTTPEVSQYLSRLTSLSLPEILQEPTNLASEASQLANSLTSLCHSEYPTFLSLRQTASVLQSSFSSFSDSLSALITAVPALETQTRQFSDETANVQAARRKARLVLQQHDALVDVLDIPALIDTCVRNAYYQEALDLSAHAAGLARRFPDVALVQDVAAEAEHATRVMLAQLLALLRDPAKLPALFKAVSFLRKMGALDELELALTFLSSRLVNLKANIGGVEERVDHARYVRRYVDVWREGVHDVVTQYTNIFLDRASSEEMIVELRYLLSTLTLSMVNDLIEVLAQNLPLVEDTTSLTSILTQLTHCSTSFAKIGLDFRSLLPPLFEEAVKERFSQAFETATSKFLQTFADAQKYSRQPSQVLVTAVAAASPPAETTLPESLRLPPHVLSSYPPLAIYTNSLLSALNSLRLLAPVAIQDELQTSLDACLAKSSSSFLVYAQVTSDSKLMKRRSMDENEPDQMQIIRTSGKVFTHVLIPYSRRALSEGVYGALETPPPEHTLQDVLTDWDKWLNSIDDTTSS